MAAMQLGKHVYVQKPLTRTISEARALTEAARKYKVVTQMGNQGHSEEGLRLMQEWFEAGAIGQVREVHCWTNRPIWPQGMPRPTEEQPVPDGMDWDLWLGPAPARPFHKTYHPFVLARLAGLRRRRHGRHGVSRDGRVVHGPEAGRADEHHRDVRRHRAAAAGRDSAAGAQRVKYNDSYPPSSLDPPDLPAARQPAAGEAALVRRRPAARAARGSRAGAQACRSRARSSSADKGKMWCETYSESPRLIPESAMQAFQRPPKTLPRVPDGRPGHEKNWLDAIRQKGQAVSHFDYAGPFTETRAARQRRAALPGPAPDVGRGEP